MEELVKGWVPEISVYWIESVDIIQLSITTTEFIEHNDQKVHEKKKCSFIKDFKLITVFNYLEKKKFSITVIFIEK